MSKTVTIGIRVLIAVVLLASGIVLADSRKETDKTGAVILLTEKNLFHSDGMKNATFLARDNYKKEDRESKVTADNVVLKEPVMIIRNGKPAGLRNH